ncbi:kinase-like domain-containing protein [Phellopilus nigrolimitatus]|nr:kinase-like domain-containing protein [Phellopilus nigrolimitatus]KAH8106642.1 kinase-like domain-containing protein [Phellopilus nigrolimitatus]
MSGVAQTAEAAAKQASREASKEIRTMRKAALSMLLHHPYICGIGELITHLNHYYMVFEYVNGGQMFDHIIRHDRLRKRVARTFSRRIGSALDYCRRTNVFHRDLKFEKTLIFQTDNIKTLKKVFPTSTILSPICPPSPDLYTSPLPCCSTPWSTPSTSGGSVSCSTCSSGKVSFNDQSVPALHSKIKRVLVECPD